MAQPANSTTQNEKGQDRTKRSESFHDQQVGGEMVFMPFEGFADISVRKAKIRGDLSKSAQTSVESSRGDMVPYDALLGTSMMNPSTERHIAMMGDPRFTHSTNIGQSARIVNRLHETYGNGHVQRVVDAVQAMQDEGLSAVEVSTGVEQTIARKRGASKPLEHGTLTHMGSLLGRDFGDVSIHTDSASDSLAKALQAKAFTIGSDVFFREGEYQPATESGKKLLGHELTHVVQQGRAPLNKQPQRMASDGKEAGSVPESITQETMVSPLQEQINQQGDSEEYNAGKVTPEKYVSKLDGTFGTGSPSTIQCWPWSAPEARTIASVPEPEEPARPAPAPPITTVPVEEGEGQTYTTASAEDWQALADQCEEQLDTISNIATFLEERDEDDSRLAQLAEIYTAILDLRGRMRSEEPPFRADALYRHERQYEELVSRYEEIAGDVIREIGGATGLRPEERGAEQRRQLTEEQLEQIRELIQGMDYSGLNGAFEDFDRWLGSQPGLSELKRAWDGTKATVDSIAAATGMSTDTPFMRRFGLFGKIIGLKGHIDAFRNIVYANQAAQGRESRVYFDRFIQAWWQQGWTPVMTRYDAFGVRLGEYEPIMLTEREFLAMPPARQARIGTQIGIGAFRIEQRTMLSVAGAQFFGILGDVAVALWDITEAILSRFFPIYGAVDFGTDIVRDIAAALSEE